MCGIYGILSSPAPVRRPDGAEFRDLIGELLAHAPSAALAADDRPLELLERARRAGYAFVDRDGFIAALTDGALADELAALARRIDEWHRGLDGISGAALESVEANERINRLMVGARDLAWQLGRDVAGNLARTRELAGAGAAGGEPSDATWGHLWALNLVLNNIDRLEVRGRDSAGVAVYAHFADAAALAAFDAALGGALRERVATGVSAGRAVSFPQTSERSLLFTYKVANEVGEMGDNVRALRRAISGDDILQRAMRTDGVSVQALAHTRWASNGIISVANCHPVDSSIFRSDEPVPGSRGAIVTVLNGDIDNYQDLYRKYIVEMGLRIDAAVTTDAKIIPIVVGHHYRECGDLAQAFRTAFDAFEGSMAIGIMAADRPGEFLFGQKGSGQGLFIGLADRSTVFASEMYGLVELTQRYIKAEGEKVRGGEIFHAEQTASGVSLRLRDGDGARELAPERVRSAEITTRDINRGEYPRFFLKEISESVETVRKTLRGKFEIDGAGKVRFTLGAGVLHPDRLGDLRAGRIRRIIAIGQGTAAIAAEGIALLLERALRGAAAGSQAADIQTSSMKATELSGHHLRKDMSDTLIVAVSQSGTTTDTNRTVDMARDRGAWIVGIVNRRNSDLVYKSHGVLYTSDGRDIEMSVASTKAFYAQNVAGQVLALALAHALGSMAEPSIRDELEALRLLPAAMQKTLALGDAIRAHADAFASRRRYWALVGSGFDKIAADEVRIKLSELCYKSIACDFTEDKKHIDLSSEPLVIVCASSTPRGMISDVVKEVAIFKAHQSIPLVITREGEDRFDPYARGVVKVPPYRGALGYLLSTMVGHLFGYHAASSFDRFAGRLRTIRTGVIQAIERKGSPETELQIADLELSDTVISQARDFQEVLSSGALDGCLGSGTAFKLGSLFQILLGRIPAQAGAGLEVPVGQGGIAGVLLQALAAAINELSRPIDAIKHQAKTVTVGISRTEDEIAAGAIGAVLEEIEIDPEDLSDAHRKFLAAFDPLVESVEGCTLYRIDGLDAVGRPREDSTIEVLRKTGCARKMYSRCESRVPLSGTKWGVVRSREIYLGLGQTDGNKILILPAVGERSSGYLVLMHLELAASADAKTRLKALAAHRKLLDRIRIAVTERNQEWQPELLESVDNTTLFFSGPERVAEQIVAKCRN